MMDACMVAWMHAVFLGSSIYTRSYFGNPVDRYVDNKPDVHLTMVHEQIRVGFSGGS